MPGEIYQIRPGKDGSFPTDGSPRRLAAILAADISGYSRLMSIDEEGTHARLKRHRRELIEPTIAEHHGRLVKNTGDGFLAIFDSPVEAVRCAIVIQQSMVGRNAALARDQWMLYRIGVNLGDVIVEADDIYGDGVNIAARLEGIANPGDLYISGGVYEQIKNKLVCGYQSLGDRRVKNITEPISVYRVLPDPGALIRARPTAALTAVVVTSVGVIASVAAAAATWYFFVWHPKQLAAVLDHTPAPTVNATKPTAAAPQTVPPTKPETTSPSVTAPTTPQVTATKPETTSPSVTAPMTPQVVATEPPALPPIIEPEMVTLPGGKFAMGSNDDSSEKPIHQVDVKPFAIGKFPITVREWNQCVTANACAFKATGKDDAPVTNVSWSDTQRFTEWLSRVTQKKYRLPSEAEWEYAARGGVQTKYSWGDQLKLGMANCNGCSEAYDATQPMKVGSFKPNPFGLYDMGGGVDQWVTDCWHKSYQAAPVDGSAWLDVECASHVIRSGSWKNDPSYVRAASRDRYDTNVRYPTHGFRVAHSL